MRVFVLLLGLPVLLAAADSKIFSSGANRIHLLELYSSEGCSSCPPAESWLGELRDSPGLWREFVPIAFHVDYWDRLGWRDKFASREYTARQYAYADRWHSENVYTPEFALDGSEWRARLGAVPTFPAARAGSLSLVYSNDGICRVTFDQPGDYEVHVALLGAGITSRIRAGENNGRVLQHDFVALALRSARLVNGSAELKLPVSAGENIPRHALALWLTRSNDLVAVQATGGWLD